MIKLSVWIVFSDCLFELSIQFDCLDGLLVFSIGFLFGLSVWIVQLLCLSGLSCKIINLVYLFELPVQFVCLVSCVVCL